ncbi:hypothetical protein [Alloprevotella tannerae]|jgi:hypothetical protein|uniref:hypothetical protein n=1 Tax=Alloprevotella tannerae TaxID=76122 RepID=UPI0025CDC7E0|nr:hypothetical protein [Alloprevotella tannerae]
MSETSSKRQVAKNAAMLYLRMIFTILVGLYTSRVVLQTLGVTDYGVYNVVAAVVPFLGFFSNSMAATTSRFVTLELGRGDIKRLQKTFSGALVIQICVALSMILLAETVGLWFLFNVLKIPAERFNVAFWVYQISALSVLFECTQVPYNACIIAHERMNVYAYVEILKTALRLVILYLLIVSDFDKLLFYAILSLLVDIFITIIYRIYCIRHFEECRFRFTFDKDILKPMLSFSGFDMFTGLCANVNFQGIPYFINIVFSVVMNAAVGIVITVTNVFRSFVGNITTAFRPQIVKLYAQEKYTEMMDIYYLSMRMLIIVMSVIIISFIYNCDFILRIWLKQVPAYTVILLDICFFETFFDVMASNLKIGVHAAGKIKGYSIFQGIVKLLVIPLAVLCLLAGKHPEHIYILNTLSTFVCVLLSVYYLKKYIPLFSVQDFCMKVSSMILPVVPTILLLYLLTNLNISEFSRLILSCGLILVSMSFFSYLFLGREERNVVNRMVKNKLFNRN